MAAKGKIVIDRERCKGCHLCLEVCPKQCLEVDPELNTKGYQPATYKGGQEDDRACNACTMCAIVCPDVAIEVYRAK
ncbi:MAG: ferredoxin family protein [Thermodesulfobacteriota bacterium]